ncbi:sulfite oxidase heme-binding subunit YedZ [Polynucleobacter brandtiae]|uniref:Protein-methionine-sulfoxide reductase heme-binding subunit MsrQ n=1 Tax=Polynucleobacter brandtiae TaxID=1938816 RepID=A0A2M8VQX0_9BURK|nr:protein-methionine-sulfoxide reductase heme-binding subunit MsrQ [Polynucleobacter brandtiae]PJI79865.1 sulfoxide reductase heme-binding subunit YedZ [Polynucleobacter brandtiae]
MKPLIFLAALIPLGRLICLGWVGDLGANPIEFITRSTGTWALVFLCLTLTMTPLRLISNSVAWVRYRRMLGLFSFFYAFLHFGIWLWLDQDFDLSQMWSDVVERPFITMGFISLVMLTPLAMTSNHWSQRFLKRRWSTLHRLIYVIACTVMLHYWWHKAGKNDFESASIYGVILFLLLCCRIPYIRNRLRLNKHA